MKIVKGILAAAVLLASVPASADVIEVGGWNLRRSSDACFLWASFEGGSTFSVLAEADDVAQEQLTFAVQNHKWTSLTDKGVYKLDIEFDNLGEWTVTSVASKRIDSDGPGLVFIRSIKTNSDGDNFLYEFALSNTIHIRRNGTSIANLSLSGTRAATLAMARCMRSIGAKGDPFAGDAPDEEPKFTPSEAPVTPRRGIGI
jgi:hypothetical protein